MSDVSRHYDTLLGPRYTWLMGGSQAREADCAALFTELGLIPARPGDGRPAPLALDLGCGPGFAALPLARAGYRVLAVDTCQALLDELAARAGASPILPLQADLRTVAGSLREKADLAVCLGDTLTHLASPDDVAGLFADLFAALTPFGRVVLTWRDLTDERLGLDRLFCPRSDAETIFTCFLEYFPDRVMVHDLVHRLINGSWVLEKSAYPKLRLGPDQVAGLLAATGFVIERDVERSGLRLAVGRKPGPGIAPVNPGVVHVRDPDHAAGMA